MLIQSYEHGTGGLAGCCAVLTRNPTNQWKIIMSYEYLHEVEKVELCSQVARPTAELPLIFRKLGFTLHDDVVSFDRHGKIPPWQHSSIVEVEVSHNGEEVFGFDEGEWDSIRLKYLFATLPYELADKFVKVAFSVSKELVLPLRHAGMIVDEMTLQRHFAEIGKELLDQTGEEAGSEGLAILIHSTYPRR